jgi:hypothetical protein
MSDVTRLLDAAAAGDRRAAADLLPLVYDELRKLAAARMAAETPGPEGGQDGERGCLDSYSYSSSCSYSSS